MVAWAIGFVAIVASTVYRGSGQATPVKVLRFLGLMTFPIYLLHNNFGLAVRAGLLRAGIADGTVGFLG
jgi:peptidoglycan/LPS O-acetylase OafA/YrhL